MQNYLKLRLNRDDDGTAGIKAKVFSGNFSGEGEACFNLSEISKFTEDLEHFAKTLKNPPTI